MNELQRKLAEQIGFLFLANVEQAAEIARLQAALNQRPEPSPEQPPAEQ